LFTSFFSGKPNAKLWVFEERMKFVNGAAGQFNKLLNGPERAQIVHSLGAIYAGGGVE
jgi:hypothetical protein